MPPPPCWSSLPIWIDSSAKHGELTSTVKIFATGRGAAVIYVHRLLPHRDFFASSC